MYLKRFLMVSMAWQIKILRIICPPYIHDDIWMLSHVQYTVIYPPIYTTTKYFQIEYFGLTVIYVFIFFYLVQRWVQFFSFDDKLHFTAPFKNSIFALTPHLWNDQQVLLYIRIITAYSDISYTILAHTRVCTAIMTRWEMIKKTRSIKR